ncbi:hypothetical protein Zm00014a_016184 [Zea mays]|uniref:Uncharacterized protein n=1 Tax=Zea mays TaxID=4577 RepID=A0A317YAI3_MAIZE|nr:hypothetical protein Zm00014a_016184 [Zea mays]
MWTHTAAACSCSCAAVRDCDREWLSRRTARRLRSLDCGCGQRRCDGDSAKPQAAKPPDSSKMAPTPGDGEELDASLPVPGLPSKRHLLPPPHPSLCSGSKRKTIAVGSGAAPMIAGSSSSSHSQSSPSVASADKDIVNPSNVVEVDDSNEVDVTSTPVPSLPIDMEILDVISTSSDVIEDISSDPDDMPHDF